MKWLSFIHEQEYYTFYFSCGATSTGKIISKYDECLVILNSLNKRIFLTKLDEVLMVEELNKPVSFEEGLNKIEKIREEASSHIKNINKYDSKKSLKELSAQKRKIEKEIIENKLREHTFSNITKVQYGIPNIRPKQQS